LRLPYLRVGDVEANELQEGPASVDVADLLFQQPVQEHRDGVGEGKRDQHKQVGDRYCARSCRTCVCVCVCVHARVRVLGMCVCVRARAAPNSAPGATARSFQQPTRPVDGRLGVLVL
jgi:hypothetical protein